MEQRISSAPVATLRLKPSSTWSLLESPFGWLALQRCDAGVLRVLMGCRSKQDLTAALPLGSTVSSESDALIGRIQNYFAGVPDEFDDVPLAVTWSTPFQRAVVNALRRVRYGATTTYGELARQIGQPRAARAVGRVMATNPVPLFVPCHRVLGSRGSLGGFSAPQGIKLKQQLLLLEAKSWAVHQNMGWEIRNTGVSLFGDRSK